MRKTNEEEEIRGVVQKVPLPDTVVDVYYRLDEDHMGLPAVWVYVVLDDAVASSPDFGDVAAGIRNAIRDALEQAGIERWPYVRFRTESEEAELAGKSTR